MLPRMTTQYSSFVAQSSVEDRAGFLVRTYLHLFGAVIAFVVLEAFWFVSGLAYPIVNMVAGTGNLGWGVVLAAFMGISWLANRWASSGASPVLQYGGLGLYVAAESLIFVPLVALALAVAGDTSLLGKAGAITLVMFGCLTGIVFLTRKDFSFMRGILMVGSVAAFGLIIASLVFGFSLGLAFCWFMVALMSGYILFDTSNVMLHYRVDQHVAASLVLFASLATLFWYVLRLVISRRD